MEQGNFLRVAEHSGLDIDASHLQDLYAYLKGLHPDPEDHEGSGFAGLEPFMPSFSKKE